MNSKSGNIDSNFALILELNKLAKRSWKGTGSGSRPNLELPPSKLVGLTPDDVARELYRHARKIAGSLDIPFGTPKVRFNADMAGAGKFRVDEMGQVHIEISNEYQRNECAFLAILAHEVCHHIAEQSGLADRKNSAKNERIVECLTIICGFGALVKTGRQGNLALDNTQHEGYLSTDQIDQATGWTLQAWNDEDLQKSLALATRNLTMAALPREVLESSLAAYRQRFPNQPDDWIYDKIRTDLRRDQR